MEFSEKLQLLRRSKGYTQEDLASNLRVSRQTVAKWESGQTYPDIRNLIQISERLHVTVDYLVKDQACEIAPQQEKTGDLEALVRFRLDAGAHTYAAVQNEVDATRLGSHDYRYEKGEYLYHDTYVGGERFAGEEAVWKRGKCIYAMNYIGRVLDGRFSGNFLKEALKAATPDMPYRGPAFYQSGEYVYQSRVVGDIEWFLGEEEIHCDNIMVYECRFHGGSIR